MIADTFFELHQLSHGLVYQFDRMASARGTPNLSAKEPIYKNYLSTRIRLGYL